jgi:hypothetical protein
MTRTNGPLSRFGPGSRDAARLRRGARPGPVEGLERRGLLSVSALFANASPTLLHEINPMNQPHAVQITRIRPVTIDGYVAVTGNSVPKVSFRVIDEYGRDQPSGNLTPQPAKPGVFFFATRIGLNRTHRPHDLDGRQYQIFVTAQDQNNSKTVVVNVTTPPHLPHHQHP